MEILKRVVKKSIFIIVPAIAASAFYEPRKLPLGIFIGWLFGIFNLRALTRNVAGLIGSGKAAPLVVFLNIMRLSLLFVAIFLLVYYRVVNIIGLLLGFTVVFIFILIEGWKVGKENNITKQGGAVNKKKS
ncbi:MAG: hypothetical protein C4538_00665 [Nitrospiraceae bacterium]|nr:MAG: hypothetical protein C4538_00665 [Nitrospiraceae bacterium]